MAQKKPYVLKNRDITVRTQKCVIQLRTDFDFAYDLPFQV